MNTVKIRKLCRWLLVFVRSFDSFLQVDKRWSKQLNKLLDEHEPTNITQNTCVIGGVEVWISNWPHSYGNPWTPYLNCLPDIATRIRLRDATKPAQRRVIDEKIDSAREKLDRSVKESAA